MKFVTLALATLLALGCQAASLQGDDPNAYVQQARDAMTMVLKGAQQGGHNIAEKITDPQVKEMVISRIDNLVAQISALRGQAEPLTDSALKTISEATADVRTKLGTDMAALQAELDPMRAELRETVLRHIDEYRAKMMPIIAEYQAQQQMQMAELKAKYQPVFEDLQNKVSTNVEETKSKLEPILNTLNAKFWQQVQTLKEMATPYVEEYKEQAAAAVQSARNIDHAAIMEKAKPHMESLKTCMDDFAAKMKTVME